jgi:hypothetical protein
MHRPRLAVTGAILSILFVGCAQSHEHVATGTPAAANQPASESPATTAVTAPPTSAAPTTTAAVDPVADNAQAPTVHHAATTTTTAPLPPATITVKFQPHDGETATATLVELGTTQSLADGSTVFRDLPAGTYTVQIDEVFPTTQSGDTGIGAADTTRSHPIAVQDGDNAVVSCDASDCTGIS